MKKLWLIFAQSATFALAFLFVLKTFYPDLLSADEPGSLFKLAGAPRQNIASYNAAASKAMPSVVNIFTSKETPSEKPPILDDPMFRRFFGDPSEDDDEAPQREDSLGSGVIVTADGLVLTNHHVIEGADEIKVALADGRTLPARIVGSDPDTDLAVLRVNAADLPAITFGRSDKLNIGDVVLAIGNPFGVGQTVTQGIVSALGRHHLGINTFENFIQTDAPINPGNSGGALVDTDGNLIGINSAIYSQSGGSVGIGFAIPSGLAQQIMEQIIHNGSVTRGWIGIEVQDVTPELAESFNLKEARGALIASVTHGSPADKAGIKPGDVLTEVNGKAVTDISDINLISGLKPGTTATIKIVRNQTERKLTIAIAKRPQPPARN
ncbi:MAG: Do family serine endopeptidase [Methylobacillus sp.]|jgi:serine protease DegQ|nr:Do family serine endopeptidase [Methylobacillus sp.]